MGFVSLQVQSNRIRYVKILAFFFNIVFTLRTSAVQPAGWTASPTLAPSSAPRTETTTAAPAGVPSSPLEVCCPTNHHPFAHLNPNLAKHSYPPPREQFIFRLRQYKVTANLQSFTWMLPFTSLNQLFSFNSLIHLLGRLVVWSMWPLQSQWHILPQLNQRGALQRH